MNINLPAAPSEFVALIHGFLADAGHETESDTPIGAVEITSGESAVVLRPHPEEANVLLLEVEAAEASTLEDDSPVWVRLHRLNAEMRFTTGWSIVVEDDAIFLARPVSISATTPQMLGSLILEGLDRAEGLRAAIEAASRLDGPPLDAGEAVEPQMLVQHA
jgi:hypothetical protein